MNFVFQLKVLLKSLLVNKRQSLLSIGALVIGIISVLLVLSLGNGVQESINQQLNTVTGGHESFTIDYSGNTAGAGISNSDLEMVENMPNVQKAQLSNNVAMKNVTVETFGHNKNVNYDKLLGKYINNKQDVHNVRGKTLRSIKNINDNEIAIKSDLAKSLFQDTNSALGKTIRVNDANYSISSVYDGVEEIPEVLMNSRVYQQVEKFDGNYNQMKVFFNGDKKACQKKVVHLLSEFGTFKSVGRYEVEDVHQVVNQINKSTGLATKLVAGVAGISLIVAGFGVMSATYSSIAERKSEIGLRRAFGATKKDIKHQFILEGIIMTFIASMVSILFVLSLSKILGNSMGIRLIITKENIMVSIFVPSIIGLAFNYLPSVKASNTNVLDLLR